MKQSLHNEFNLQENDFDRKVYIDMGKFPLKSRLQSENQLYNTPDENLKIAVVGTYSCGKSAFINSILADEVAPVEITPKTHGITSFLFGTEEKYDADGKAISRNEYQKQVQDDQNKVKHFIVYYPCERLKNYEFIDSPGFGPVTGKDEKVAQKDSLLSEQAVRLADVVFFLINIVAAGTIQGDELERLEKICFGGAEAANPHRKIFVILTWADRKPPKERTIVQQYIQNRCSERKLPIEAVLLYSSLPLDQLRPQSQKNYFRAARENLFQILINLRNLRTELKKYRRDVIQYFEQQEFQHKQSLHDKFEDTFTQYSDLLGDGFVRNFCSELKEFQNNSSQHAENQLRNTSDENLKIAVVGAFSCGKSTFINSILADGVAPVEIKPKTHGITSFLFSPEEKYDADGKAISRKEYQKQVQDGQNKVKHFIVYYPCDRLKNFEFIDSPGFGSVSDGGNKVAEKDSLLSEQAVRLADVVFFLTNITEGVIQGDALERLEKICSSDPEAANPHRKIFVILTWADKKSPKERTIVQQSIQNLCSKRKLPIEAVLLYSSLPLKELQPESQKNYFNEARENLFQILINLRNLRTELKKYRQALKQHFDQREIQRIIERFVRGSEKILDMQENLLASELKSEFNLNWFRFREEAADCIYNVFKEKDAKEHHRWLVGWEERKLFSKGKVWMIARNDVVELDVKEVESIIKKLRDVGIKYQIPVEKLEKGALKNFLTTQRETNIDWSDVAYDSNSGGCSCNERYLKGSLGDLYLRICVEMITSLGGPWYYYESDDNLIDRKFSLLKELTDLFNNNARDKFSEMIDSEMKAAASKAVLEPMIQKARSRIEKLKEIISEVKQEYGLDVATKRSSPKTAKSIPDTKKTVKANKIFDELL